MAEVDNDEPQAWLVHFFRSRDYDADLPASRVGAFWDFPRNATALEVMTTSILLGGILNDCPVNWPWLDFNGMRVAVSASEDGLSKMLALEDGTSSTGGVTGYGVAIRKSEFVGIGGTLSRPRENNELKYADDAGWYWRPSIGEDSIRCSTFHLSSEEYDYAPGLALWTANIRPDVIGKTYLIVPTEHEAAGLQALLTAMFLAEENCYGTYFDKHAIETTRIVVLDSVRAKVQKAQLRFDELSDDDTLPSLAFTPSTIAMDEKVEQAFAEAERVAQIAGARYRLDHPDDLGSGGEVELFVVGAGGPMLQLLLKNRWAFLSRKPERHVVPIQHTWPPTFSNNYASAVYQAAAEILEESLGLNFDVHITNEF